MAITNLNNDHFSEEEKNIINSNWENIRQVLNSKKRNLSPEERQKKEVLPSKTNWW